MPPSASTPAMIASFNLFMVFLWLVSQCRSVAIAPDRDGIIRTLDEHRRLAVGPDLQDDVVRALDKVDAAIRTVRRSELDHALAAVPPDPRLVVRQVDHEADVVFLVLVVAELQLDLRRLLCEREAAEREQAVQGAHSATTSPRTSLCAFNTAHELSFVL